MKIDDAIIDKVLNNKASAEDAKAVSEWLATDDGELFAVRSAAASFLPV